MKIGKLALRAVQLIFMAVVIGLSATLVKGQVSGNVPSITTFSLVCGIWGFLVALVGIAATFAESLERLAMVVLDGLATLFFFSGSIAMAAKLGVGSCDGDRPPGWDNTTTGATPPNPYCTKHGIINGGSIEIVNPVTGRFIFSQTNDWYVSRCRMAQADVAFLFFGLVTFAATLVLSLLAWKRGGTRLSAV